MDAPAGFRMTMKRIFDFILAAAALLAFLPLLLMLALLVRRCIGSPILFRQERLGAHGKRFVILKFRTMTDGRSPTGELLPDGERLTSVGRWLRATSLDELPELWNILKGEMSFVGPRPLLPEYLPLYSPEQARRQEIRPGLTGWAQVNGRNRLSWEEKFALDVWYVDHRNLLLDLKILCLTSYQMLKGYGVTAEGEPTMPKFKGSSRP
jgi:lipopolysaccharide/colanic/teichoic acid biosynthesis glycosyltransferase